MGNNMGVTVSELRPEDMRGFLKWGSHTDMRFWHYSFPDIPERQLMEWYRAKKIPFLRWLYVAKDDSGNLLGYMTVKGINRIFRRAELGIVFDPARLDQGYGTESMIKFLRIYFFEKNMNEIWLRVALFNKRAHRAYEKVGFEDCGICREPFEEQGRNFDLLLNYPKDFYMEGDVLMSSFNKMKLTKRRYIALHGK